MRSNGLDARPAGRARHARALNGAAILEGHPSSSLPAPPAERSDTTSATPLVRVVLLVLLPFVIGYYLSYLYRSINALISEALVSEFALSPGNLGFLTATYFLAFGLIQLPLGVWVDRFGPRRVQAVLLTIAVAGAMLFATAEGFVALALGRGLIGLGVAGALMAGLKAIVLWFPPERIALANGWFIMLGALGAVTATAPAEIVLAHMGWRGVFAVLAAMNGPPEVDVHGSPPVRHRCLMASPDTGRRVAGQEVDLAEPCHDGVAQPLNLLRVGNVGRRFEDPLRAAWRNRLQRINGSIQFLTGQVRHHDRHACLGKPHAHRATDTESRAGHNGIVGLNDRGCGHAATPRRLASA